MYQNFSLVISERWQAEVAETVFDTINQEADKAEAKKKSKHRKFDLDEKGEFSTFFFIYYLFIIIFSPRFSLFFSLLLLLLLSSCVYIFCFILFYGRG